MDNVDNLVPKLLKLLRVVADEISNFFEDRAKRGRKKTFESCFGETVYSHTFFFDDAKNWINRHTAQIQNGCSAAVLKLNEETFKMFNDDPDIDLGNEKYLVLCIIDSSIDDESPVIRDSLLVKYGNLDDSLEEALMNGDGVFVVEGE